MVDGIQKVVFEVLRLIGQDVVYEVMEVEVGNEVGFVKERFEYVKGVDKVEKKVKLSYGFEL